MATYKSEAKFSDLENKRFRSLLQSIHPDKNGNSGLSDEEKALLAYATAIANAARDKNQWRTVELLIEALEKGMPAFLDYVRGLKEKAEKAEQPKGEQAKAKAKEKAEKGPININPETLKKARDFVANAGYTVGRAGLGEWLRAVFGMTAAEAKAYCDEIFVKPAGATRTGFASQFYDTLKAGPMSDQAFEEWLKAGSDNVRANKSHYDAIRQMANAIWASK